MSSLPVRVGDVIRRTWRRASEGDADGDNLAPRAAELFSVSQLEEHARALAARHRLASARASLSDTLLPRLTANAIALREAHDFITQVAAEGTRITPAAEWFIDNYHIIQEQIRGAAAPPPGLQSEAPQARQPRRGACRGSTTSSSS